MLPSDILAPYLCLIASSRGSGCLKAPVLEACESLELPDSFRGRAGRAEEVLGRFSMESSSVSEAGDFCRTLRSLLAGRRGFRFEDAKEKLRGCLRLLSGIKASFTCFFRSVARLRLYAVGSRVILSPAL